MTYYVGNMPVGEHLAHYGTKGMKWGQRRYQNPDGSLTAAGRLRYGTVDHYRARQRMIRSAGNLGAVAERNVRKGAVGRSAIVKAGARYNRDLAAYRKARKASKPARKAARSEWYNRNKKKIGRAAAIAGGVALGAGAAYLGYRNRGAIKGLAKNIGSRVRDSARTPWYARGVEGGVRRNVAKAEAAAARANAKRQVNSAFAGEGLAIRKHSKVGDAFKRASMNAGYYAGKAKNAANNAAGSAKRAYYKAKKGVKNHAKNRAKAGRYPGWVKDTAKSYAGKAKRTATKAKDKASELAGLYGIDAALAFGTAAASYGTQAAYDKYGKNPRLKSDRWRKKNGYKANAYGIPYISLNRKKKPK